MFPIAKERVPRKVVKSTDTILLLPMKQVCIFVFSNYLSKYLFSCILFCSKIQFFYHQFHFHFVLTNVLSVQHNIITIYYTGTACIQNSIGNGGGVAVQR